MAALWQDLLYGWQMMKKHRGFLAMIVVALTISSSAIPLMLVYWWQSLEISARSSTSKIMLPAEKLQLIAPESGKKLANNQPAIQYDEKPRQKPAVAGVKQCRSIQNICHLRTNKNIQKTCSHLRNCA